MAERDDFGDIDEQGPWEREDEEDAKQDEAPADEPPTPTESS